METAKRIPPAKPIGNSHVPLHPPKADGSELYSRKLKSQQTETAVKILCLNKMTRVGMPVSEKVA